jgi:hypothetical protein
MAGWIVALALLPAAFGDPKVHVVFSSGCTMYQNWQSELLAWSAKKVGHEGPITRIASGCDEKTDYDGLRRSTNDRLRVHITPVFDLGEGKDYFPFYNKPFGLQHWLGNADPPIEEEYIAVIDPDFIFLKPFDPFQLNKETMIFTGRNPKDIAYANEHNVPSQGHPVGQQYGIGPKWVHWMQDIPDFITKVDLTNSPAKDVSLDEANQYYSVGPPYILHKEDARKLVDSWVGYMIKIRENFPKLVEEDVLAEMYAYCLAAGHHELKHTQLANYMVSAVDSAGEAWKWVDEATECANEIGNEEFVSERGVMNYEKCPEKPGMPQFLHMATAYVVQDFKVHKKHIPLNILECEAPIIGWTDCNVGSNDLKRNEANNFIYYSKTGVKKSDCVKSSPREVWKQAGIKSTKCEYSKRNEKCMRAAWMATVVLTNIQQMQHEYKEEFCEVGYNVEETAVLRDGEDQGLKLDPQGAAIGGGGSRKGLKKTSKVHARSGDADADEVIPQKTKKHLRRRHHRKK